MGINSLQLSPELIAALYPETLVAGNDPAGTGGNILSKGPVYPFLGKNLQSICFLVSYPGEPFIPEESFVFLHKILAACKCSLDDIALINTKQLPVEMETIKKQFHPRIIFLWGALPAMTDIHQKFPDMTISIWDNISVIPVLQADLMSTDHPESLELKRSLWISLKKLFPL